MGPRQTFDKYTNMETGGKTKNAKIASVRQRCNNVAPDANWAHFQNSIFFNGVGICTIQGPHSSARENCCDLVCGCVTQETSENVTVFWFSPEHWRSLMYICFILMMLIDAVVTTVFADISNPESTILSRMYGCVSLLNMFAWHIAHNRSQ